ncbi:MAG: glycerol kinase [Candidatus Rokuibacteriota bacterium]|nr:MAG: glycerol kinase [Candidatus Rokubacteria bacterium]
MSSRVVLALDQGTSGTTALVVDSDGRVIARGYAELPQYYPQPGWVEHDPEEIWATVGQAATVALAEARVRAADIAAVGITNQRETTIVWDRTTGAPIHRAIVWQCRRTAPFCERLRAAGLESHVRERTGLVLDAYFSGTKIRWLLDEVPGARKRAEAGELAFGTVDAWLLWKLTGGRVHATDVTIFGETRGLGWLPDGVPIAGVAGDQQAALFGHACYVPGDAKNTYGTGCFLLLNTGHAPVASRHGLLTTIAWRLDGRITYALEGSVFIAGAAIQWLRDGLGVLRTAADSQRIAESVPDTGGVYLVPAFVGLGAPYWDMRARGTIVGLTRGTTAAHLTRAALEAIAYQSRDVLEAMTADAGIVARRLRVDGGASTNDFLCQFQADILDIPVIRPAVTETTGLGAAYLAGVGAGLWRSLDALAARASIERTFEPAMNASTRARCYDGWRRAVERALQWEPSDPSGPRGEP